MDNLTTWKYLQNNNYFENHRQYRDFQLASEDKTIIAKIKTKTMIDVGCGYGRETYYFSKYAKKVWGIEVSEKIIGKAINFIFKHGDISKMSFVLADNYEKKITKPIDFIYSRHVFQHISQIHCIQYLKFFKKVLAPKGSVDLLFRIGDKKNFPKKQEPLVEYTPKEIYYLFQNYDITSITKHKGENYTLWRIMAQ